MVESTGDITAVYDDSGKMVFDAHEIEEVITSHFATRFEAKREPCMATGTNPEDHVDMARAEMEFIINASSNTYNPCEFEEQVCMPYTYSKLDDELKALPNGKSAGLDSIPNELLKNSGTKFRAYLHTFLNKMLELGKVPQELNAGKCMLIFKVGNRLVNK